MEELSAASPGKTNEMLDVGGAGGNRANRCCAVRTLKSDENCQHGDAASDLEPPALDVLMRDRVEGEVERDPKQRGDDA